MMAALALGHGGSASGLSGSASSRYSCFCKAVGQQRRVAVVQTDVVFWCANAHGNVQNRVCCLRRQSFASNACRNRLLRVQSVVMLSALLPSVVVSLTRTENDPEARLFPEELIQVRNAVDSRIREFSTTRDMARQALQRLGYPKVAILHDECRAPIWPSGVVEALPIARVSGRSL